MMAGGRARARNQVRNGMTAVNRFRHYLDCNEWVLSNNRENPSCEPVNFGFLKNIFPSTPGHASALSKDSGSTHNKLSIYFYLLKLSWSGKRHGTAIQ